MTVLPVWIHMSFGTRGDRLNTISTLFSCIPKIMLNLKCKGKHEVQICVA